MKFLIMQSSPASRYFSLLIPNIPLGDLLSNIPIYVLPLTET